MRGEGDDALQPGRGRFGLKNVLLVSQVVLSCVLLVNEGIYLRALAATQSVDLGFSLEGLAFIETDPVFAGYTPEQAEALSEVLRDQISALPGVESATLSAGPPPAWQGFSELVIDGYESPDGEGPSVPWVWAGREYFDVLRVPLLHGRSFSDFDRPETPGVTVINETMARRYFGTANAVGRRFRLMSASGSAEDRASGPEVEVIGVVPDLRTSLEDEPGPLFYRSVHQGRAITTTVLVRTAVDPASLLQPMLQTVRSVDAALPVVATKTVTQHVSDSLGARRPMGTLLGALGVLGLCLASLGLYAVVSFAVSRRSREIGIRMALGARQTRVIWVLSRNVAKLLAVGVALGLAVSWGVLRVVTTMVTSLDQASDAMNLNPGPTADPMTFVLVMLLMVAVGLAATFFPAWRATRAGPLAAVRHL